MEKKSADEVFREKYEERGWFDKYDISNKDKKDIEPLSMTENEYKEFAAILAHQALEEKDEKMCETYFELQRRAVYANGFYPDAEMEELEEQMWALGTDEKIENIGRHLR